MSTRKQPTILFVQDKARSGRDETLTLERYGFKVIIVHTRKKALAAIQTSPEIDLVLIGVNPGKGPDGFQVAEIILQQRDLPLIFLSSQAAPDGVKEIEDLTSSGEVIVNSGENVLMASIKTAFRLFESRMREKQIAEALSASEEKLKLTQAIGKIGHWSWNMAPDRAEWSDQVYKIFGAPREEASYQLAKSFVHPEDLDFWQNTIRQAVEKQEPFSLDFRVLRPEGKTIWVHDETRTVFNERGELIGYQGTVQDITERKRTEETLEKTQQQLKLIFDTVPALIWQKGLDEKYVAVNRAYCQTFGLAEEDIIGKTDHDLFPAETADQFIGDDRRILISGVPEFGIEEHFQKPSGERGWNRTDKMVYHDDEGKVAGTIGFASDITERKLAEEELRKSVERFKRSMEATSDGLWDWNIKTDEAYFSPAYYRMLGYELGDFPGKGNAWKDLIHTEDRERALQANLDCIEGRRETFEVEYRMKAKNGEWHWILGRGKCMARDDQGRALRLVGTHVDVTGPKQAEEGLKKSQEKLRALSAHIQSVREEERANISREIHDDLGQRLTGLKMDLGWLLRHLNPNQPELKKKIQALGQSIDQTVQTVRRISSELRPRILDDFGLVAALEWQAQEFAAKTGITCRFRSTLKKLDLKPDLSIAVFRIFQEALTNVVRHAQATRLETSLIKKGRDLVLTIRDNGRGISPEEIAHTHSLGLVGMRERALIFGGAVAIEGKKGKGTSIILRLPAASLR